MKISRVLSIIDNQVKFARSMCADTTGLLKILANYSEFSQSGGVWQIYQILDKGYSD